MGSANYGNAKCWTMQKFLFQIRVEISAACLEESGLGKVEGKVDGGPAQGQPWSWRGWR